MDIFVVSVLGYLITLTISVFLLVDLGIRDKIEKSIEVYGGYGGIIHFIIFLLSPAFVLIILPAILIKVVKVVCKVTVSFYKGVV